MKAALAGQRPVLLPGGGFARPPEALARARESRAAEAGSGPLSGQDRGVLERLLGN